MANLKISQLNDGNPAQAADQVPVNRAGTNFRLTAGSVNPGLGTQTANTVYAGPAAGAAAAGSFRALVAADIPVQTNWFMGDVPPTGLTMAGPAPVTLSTGTTQIYTVPAGKRAYVWGEAYNTSVGNILIDSKISKDSGATYTPLNNQATLATVTGSAFATSGLILEAGDIWALTTATNNGLNVFPAVYLFSNTAKIKQVLFTAFASGDNIVYTCPGGKTATVISGVAGMYNNNGATLSQINATGGSVTYQVKFTPSGSATLTVGTAVTINNALGAATRNAILPPSALNNLVLNAGDAIVVNSSSATAGQATYFNVYET